MPNLAFISLTNHLLFQQSAVHLIWPTCLPCGYATKCGVKLCPSLLVKGISLSKIFLNTLFKHFCSLFSNVNQYWIFMRFANHCFLLIFAFFLMQLCSGLQKYYQEEKNLNSFSFFLEQKTITPKIYKALNYTCKI